MKIVFYCVGCHLTSGGGDGTATIYGRCPTCADAERNRRALAKALSEMLEKVRRCA